jgi:NADH-quinone oxidoreductase subunit E
VNGERYELELAPLARLADVLRDDLGLVGTKIGCGEGACGACAVLVDGRSVNSCLLYAAAAEGHEVETIEGISRDGLTPLQEAFVASVASFYTMYYKRPMGTYHVQVCTNISCMLRGGEEILDHCKNKLGIGHKQTTPDGTFSLEEVECIGACSWAPAVQVNYDFHENLTADKMDRVLDSYRKK